MKIYRIFSYFILHSLVSIPLIAMQEVVNTDLQKDAPPLLFAKLGEHFEWNTFFTSFKKSLDNTKDNAKLQEIKELAFAWLVQPGNLYRCYGLKLSNQRKKQILELKSLSFDQQIAKKNGSTQGATPNLIGDVTYFFGGTGLVTEREQVTVNENNITREASDDSDEDFDATDGADPLLTIADENILDIKLNHIRSLQTTLAAQELPTSELMRRVVFERLDKKANSISELLEEAALLIKLPDSTCQTKESWASTVLEEAYKTCQKFYSYKLFDIACLLSTEGRLDFWIKKHLKGLRNNQSELQNALNRCDCNQVYTPVHAVAQTGSLSTLKLLVKAGGDAAILNTNNPNKDTLLMLAAFNRHYKMVKYLIKHGGVDTINNTNSQQITALYCAAAGGDPKILLFLIKKGAKIESAPNAEPAVRVAMRLTHLDAFKALLDAGVDPNTTFDDMPLLADAIKFYAVGQQNFVRSRRFNKEEQTKFREMIRLLLEHKKIDVNHKSDEGPAALETAENYLLHDIAEELIKKGAKRL